MESCCRFLEPLPCQEGKHPYGCGIGLNFYSVGKGRELCRSCPMPTIEGTPHCQHLEFYTVLQAGRDGSRSIRVELDCTLKHCSLADISECSGCPDFQAG